MKQVRLGKTEIWIAEHSVRIFLTVAALIIAGAVAVFLVFLQQGETQHQVDVLKPQVTKIVRAAATCSAQTVKQKRTSNACATRLRLALVVCRRSARCRAALLAIVNYPPPARAHANPEVSSGSAGDTAGGGGAQNPSHAGQQPGPGSQPGHQGGHGHSHGGSQQPAPTPSPSPSPTPTPSPEPTIPTLPNGKPFPGVGPPGGPPGLQVCAAGTCVEAEVGFGH